MTNNNARISYLQNRKHDTEMKFDLRHLHPAAIAAGSLLCCATATAGDPYSSYPVYSGNDLELVVDHAGTHLPCGLRTHRTHRYYYTKATVIPYRSTLCRCSDRSTARGAYRSRPRYMGNITHSEYATMADGLTKRPESGPKPLAPTANVPRSST